MTLKILGGFEFGPLASYIEDKVTAVTNQNEQKYRNVQKTKSKKYKSSLKVNLNAIYDT